MSADVRPPGAATRRWGWWYVAEHRISHLRSFWVTLIGISFGSPFLYIMGLGLGLGVLVDQNQGSQGVGGVSYLTFVVPALALSTVMQDSANENTFGTYGGFKWTHWYPTQYATPVTPWQMVIGSQLGILARTTITALCYVVAIALFGIGPLWRALWLLPISVLLSLAVGFAVTSWVSTQTEDRGQLSFVERFVITPLALFSGTFYPLEVLPGYLHWIGWISPLWHAVQLGRWGFYGADVPAWLLVVHVSFLAGLAVVTAWLSVRTFRRRLDV